MVIFRGTFNKLGWMTNMDIRARYTVFGPIHNGFARDFVYIQSSLFTTKILLDRSKKIFIAGHSKGGALASLCAIFLIENGFSKTSTYTFGAPSGVAPTVGTLALVPGGERSAPAAPGQWVPSVCL